MKRRRWLLFKAQSHPICTKIRIKRKDGAVNSASPIEVTDDSEGNNEKLTIAVLLIDKST